MEEREPGWNAAHGYALPDEPDSAAMRWGTAFESAVIKLAERERGKKIDCREVFCATNGNEYFCGGNEAEYFDVDRCFITCHIDGAYFNGKENWTNCLHEGKTTTAFTFREKWGEPGTDHIPRAYQVQVQHQLLCTGAKEAVVSVLVFPETPDTWERMGWVTKHDNRDGSDYLSLEHSTVNDDGSITTVVTGRQRFTADWASVLADMGYFHQYPVRAHPENQRVMVERYREFWHNHVLTGRPPEPRNYEDVKRLFTEPVGTIVCDAAMKAWILEYNAIMK
jgi:hypothetical protein